MHTDGSSDLTLMLKGALLELAEEDSASQRERDRFDLNVTSSRVSDWLIGLDCPPAADEPVARTHELQPTISSEVEEEVILPDKHDYREVVFKSEAYKTLVGRITREASLTLITGSDAVSKIRSAILKTLPSQQYVSRHVESEMHTMVLRVAWEPVAFLEHEYGSSEKPREMLGRVITLTGSMSNAQALPCSDYLSQTWPMTGPHVLAVVGEALQSGDGATSKSASRQPLSTPLCHC